MSRRGKISEFVYEKFLDIDIKVKNFLCARTSMGK